MGFFQTKKKKKKENEDTLGNQSPKDESSNDDNLLSSLDALDLEDDSDSAEEEPISPTPLFKSKPILSPSSQVPPISENVETSRKKTSLDMLESALEERDLDDFFASPTASSSPKEVPESEEAPDQDIQEPKKVFMTETPSSLSDLEKKEKEKPPSEILKQKLKRTVVRGSLSSLSALGEEEIEEPPLEETLDVAKALKLTETVLEAVETAKKDTREFFNSDSVQPQTSENETVLRSTSASFVESSTPPPSTEVSSSSAPSITYTKVTERKYSRKRMTQQRRKNKTAQQLIRPAFFLKIVLCGDGAVGKTALRERFLGKGFSASYLQTIGADFATTDKQLNIIVDGQAQVKTARFQIWDLAGQDSFDVVRKTYYEGCLGALMVFDITRRASFENIPNWIDELWKYSKRGKPPIVLLGNKADLKAQVPNSVTDEEIRAFLDKINATPEFVAKNIKIPYFETSALTGLNVEHAFISIGDVIMKSIQNS
ncbi:MAG: Rab family GTPase [Candidatus Hermodarchaeota archaeon]